MVTKSCHSRNSSTASMTPEWIAAKKIRRRFSMRKNHSIIMLWAICKYGDMLSCGGKSKLLPVAEHASEGHLLARIDVQVGVANAK